MSRKNVIVLTIVLSLLVLVGCSKDPLKTYKDSAIETLEDYRVAKITYKEAKDKLDSLADRLKNIDGDEDTQLHASLLSATLRTISSRLSYSDFRGEPSAKEIDDWILEIKSIK